MMKAMRTIVGFGLVVAALAAGGCGRPGGGPTDSPGSAFVGSSSCRACHAVFHQRWATSWHGLAMQPFTAALAARHLTPQRQDLVVAGTRYRVGLAGPSPHVLESGPRGDQKLPIAYALGGKNVYYFLTPRERGRLQVLPLGYDVRRREWFDIAASGLRHVPGGGERPLHWTETQFTFNTSCFSCHVSQLERHYDLATDSYRTLWAEPGINCETCHGPAGEHLRVFRRARRGEPPRDPAIVSTKRFTAAQMNDLCGPCHAKMSALTPTFAPGAPYFDNFDLVTLEDADFYPDGRDLGENYTLTQWLLSPCVRPGRMTCMQCHTSSGLFRQAAHPDSACAPCHGDKVADPAAHSRHAAGSPGSRCLACHMPQTAFARMVRTDHSLRAPLPAATLAFGSPNACNLCHTDRDARWADAWVRRWRARDYQAPELHRAGLVAAARRRDWSQLPEMLAYVSRTEGDEVYRNSLVRLLGACEDPRKWPVILAALRDPSPLVRSSAAAGLEAHPTPATVRALLAATADPLRLVRVQAAASLAGVPRGPLALADRTRLDRATEEYLTALRSRPDDYASHHSLGGFYLDRGDAPRAVAALETARRLRPDSAPVLVNLALAYGAAGRAGDAERSLRAALRREPASAPAHFNLGLLLAEQRRSAEAEQALRQALQDDSTLAPAAFNLGVLLAERGRPEAARWARRAVELRPAEARYAYTLAYVERQMGRPEEAIRELRRLLAEQPAYGDAHLLLGETYEGLGRVAEARRVYAQAAANAALPPETRERFARRAAAAGAGAGR